jgi:hypothetical protein
MVFAQDKDDKQSAAAQEEQGNDLVGVWEEFDVPAETDCVTGLPLPGTPTIRALYSFNQGGTMYEEDTLSLDRHRTTGGGIWKRTSGRNYTYVNLHYVFDPGGTFLFTIKQKGNLTLSGDGNSFTEKGTFEAIDPSGNIIFAGCFAATAQRLRF